MKLLIVDDNPQMCWMIRAVVADLAVYAMLRNVRSGTFGGAQQRLADRPALLAFMRRVEAVTDGASTDPRA